MSKFKESFYNGMNRADDSAPQVNMAIAGLLMLGGSLGFIYVALNGPQMIIFKIAALLGCAALVLGSYRNFNVWALRAKEKALADTANAKPE